MLDIFNRPPAIAGDTLQYVIHPGSLSSDKSAVTALATLIDSYVASALPNYIWHRDSFALEVVKVQSAWIIEGRMRVGDCIDDEWCVVWLLRDISRRYDIAISVFDSDGEFLLIEAAEHLPSWITPENSENRVWIYKGHLHLIPLNYVSADSTGGYRRTRSDTESDDDLANQDDGSEYISLLDAVPIVFDDNNATLTIPDLEQAAFRRIEGYPGVARQHIHYTKGYIPQDIALALSENPGLVQKAVEAFYTRDAPQMRAAARMSRFSPERSVLATVKMTRTAYAQLMGQKFRPPKVFGEWTEKENETEWRRKDIGMKIACGFEMMYQESKAKNEIYMGNAKVDNSLMEARKEALRRDPEYVKYIKSLENFGYFKGELNTSAQWQIQEDRAVSQFIHSRQTDDANRSSFATLVTSAIFDAQKHLDSGSTPDFASQEEDSDEWLSVTKSMMENMLSETSQELPPKPDDMDVDEGNATREMASEQQTMAQAKQLRGLAEKVGKFIEGEGDVEGATFEDDLLSDDADHSVLSDSDNESGSDSNAAAERQAALDRLVPALDASEYGTMPASFHRNSQKVKAEIQEEQDEEIRQDLPLEGDFHARAVRPLIFPRDQFDGVEDSDDESEEEGIAEDDDEEEEDMPMVVGEVEIDMKDEEEEFLKFSRETLGISADMWENIIQDRKDRGAFLPRSALHEQVTQNGSMLAAASPSTQNAKSEGTPSKNATLNSFETVMQAMDAELSRAKRGERDAGHEGELTASEKSPQAKGKKKAIQTDEDMQAELSAGMDSSDEEIGNGSMDYTLMKNFLESFKSQQGLSGPVSNLVGRLGWQLPKDDS
ncbi:SGT1 protein-domain-containing protein [Hysterangium stoloniferum]|nr:SGT1 protein-domain-containing protein [Hysterangium stoloniferum]